MIEKNNLCNFYSGFLTNSDECDRSKLSHGVPSNRKLGVTISLKEVGSIEAATEYPIMINGWTSDMLSYLNCELPFGAEFCSHSCIPNAELFNPHVNPTNRAGPAGGYFQLEGVVTVTGHTFEVTFQPQFLIALRDIQPHEPVTISYGKDIMVPSKIYSGPFLKMMLDCKGVTPTKFFVKIINKAQNINRKERLSISIKGVVKKISELKSENRSLDLADLINKGYPSDLIRKEYPAVDYPNMSNLLRRRGARQPENCGVDCVCEPCGDTKNWFGLPRTKLFMCGTGLDYKVLVHRFTGGIVQELAGNARHRSFRLSYDHPDVIRRAEDAARQAIRWRFRTTDVAELLFVAPPITPVVASAIEQIGKGALTFASFMRAANDPADVKRYRNDREAMRRERLRQAAQLVGAKQPAKRIGSQAQKAERPVKRRGVVSSSGAGSESDEESDGSDGSDGSPSGSPDSAGESD